MVRKRKPKYLVKKKKKAIEKEKTKERTIEEKFYWVKVITAVVSSLFGVLVFDLRGWWMFLYLAGFMLVWPFLQSFVIFRLPYKKKQWDWKKILKTGVGAFFFSFMLISTVCFTIITYGDYKDKVVNPADTYDIIIEDHTAYVADGQNGLLVLDISNYNSRILLGKYYTNNIDARFIEKQGKNAFLVDNNYGIRILDVSDPTNINMISKIEINSSITKFLLNQSKMIVATANDGIFIIDCLDPANPSNLVYLEANNSILSAKLSSDLLIYSVSSNPALKIVNVSNFNSPIDLYTIQISNDTFNDIEMKNDVIFLSTSNHGLILYNISNPSAPELINSYNFTANPGQNQFIFENTLFYNTPDNGTFFIDITNPFSPNINTSRVYNSLGNAYNFDVEGKYLYIADGVRGIDRVDILNPGPSPVSNDTATKRSVPFGWEGLLFAGLILPMLVKKSKKQF
ncbi:MAG: hypothetical protein DRO88_11980 [Promethearchaeia archaeon]|nr:MAG: hypothetical protein DRO88_11980 [Candidatus Lokiarchaeia archaeon]